MPPLSWRWVPVWRRNYLVWKKLAAESVLGNIIEPLFYLVGFGMGIGAMVQEVEGVKDITDQQQFQPLLENQERWQGSETLLCPSQSASE